MNNIAFIDGQNLYMGTKTCDLPWEVDLVKFKFYLEKKYRVSEIYYFLGYVQDKNEELYDEIQIEENKFEKILFPNKKYASSLYKKLGRKYFAHLEDVDIKKKISK
ncbi:MAG: hypothetical protein A2556_00755 [Candidatus Vogelbacteria bacterium RIFOXYD2_FULL_44_9]|uniref:NYN domain-containing protein n=1 Tax=Candidatus Vogelbacteria bacterium RIFOXYD2_FULL_44_9 TaxID=1802441 RepID=A0A1G2QME8_9BACT|nr:MAG: hypothetical protein A2556_00755 [Candidatus Vogelbacteria bacterium RIFOXYD2_FULL_44_9]